MIVVDEDDVFEIDDFFVASDLERWVALFEGLFKDWASTPAGRASQFLTQSGVDADVEFHIASDDADNHDDDDDLVSMFDIGKYVLVVPRSADHARYVLSAACMAACNVGFPVPILAAPADNMLIGHCIDPVHLLQVETLDPGPPSLSTLSGVTELFHECTKTPGKALVSVTYRYGQGMFVPVPQCRTGGFCNDVGEHWGIMPPHPIVFHLNVHWTPFPEGTFVDSAIFSDLQPLSAPVWEVHARLRPGPALRLSRKLATFVATCRKCESCETLQDIANLDRSFTPLYVVEHEVKAVFTDPALSASRFSSSNNPTKACPFRSILSNLVFVMQRYGGEPHRLAQIYLAFVTELQQLWDRCLPIPLPDDGTVPDMSSCIVHQKLQVLARCIEIRRVSVDQRPQVVSPAASRKMLDFSSGSSGDDDDAQVTEDDAVQEAPMEQPVGVNRDVHMPPGTTLLGTQRPMHVPITLEQPLLTEDQVEAQHEMLAGLGTDPESSKVRAELQSASLASDMSAFKAANPGARLVDFVRWYSPNDFVDGRLSQRMSDGDQHHNPWRKLWARAVPCPAAKQKPLFDAVAQGELILDYLRTISPGRLMGQLAAIAVSNAAHVIANVFPDVIAGAPRTRAMLESLMKHADPDLVADAEQRACLAHGLPQALLDPHAVDALVHNGRAQLHDDSDRRKLIGGLHPAFQSLDDPDEKVFVVAGRNGERVAVRVDGTGAQTGHSRPRSHRPQVTIATQLVH
ncbi:Rab3 GTPase-activating protein catalytic subunit [Plasmodiophora brassicae]|uniref:Rab3 GTPase-activating protein catalytic subunit n=1 Tax=Plasmodiophora brassicae TaxID=37360 RepID=A0A0G4IWY5_PLABS|nr:hypothetical protein PBRA_007491 [Plasmodiophora brassicae]